MLNEAEKDELRPFHPEIDSYGDERLDRLEKAFREVHAYHQEQRSKRRHLEPSEYTYSQSGKRRARYNEVGRLEEEEHIQMLGFWPVSDQRIERDFFVLLGLLAAVFFGAALERFGPLRVAVWTVSASGFLLFLFCVITLQNRDRADPPFTRRRLLAGVAFGALLWVSAGIWLVR